MEEPYHNILTYDTRESASFLAKNGQALLPMVSQARQRLPKDFSCNSRGFCASYPPGGDMERRPPEEDTQ